MNAARHAPAHRRLPARRKQSGVALIMSLILLVLMTLLGLAAIRGVTQQERMAANSQSRNVSFQAAEKTLRDIEAAIEAASPRITQTAGTCATVSALMVCGPPAASDTPRWRDASFNSWANWNTIGTGALAITPQYFVEYLGNSYSCNPADAGAINNCYRYRITARAGGSGGRAMVMLQSVYATE